MMAPCPTLHNNLPHLYKLCNLKIINNYGYVNAVKWWYFAAIYENS